MLKQYKGRLLSSIEVELVTDIIPPVDWLPNKYRYIDNEWVINN